MSHSNPNSTVGRREFLQAVAIAGSSLVMPVAFGEPPAGEALEITDLLGKLQRQTGKTLISGASWFSAEAVGDGIAYRFPAGSLLKAKYLSSDMLLDGNNLLVFSIALQEGDTGPTFRLVFGGLPQCS